MYEETNYGYIINLETGRQISKTKENPLYQDYLAWKKRGNTPRPAAPDKFSEFYKFDSKAKKWVVDESKKAESMKLATTLINRQTDKKIFDGIEYSGVRFYLTAENQRNFAELDRNRKDLTYPFKVWCGAKSVTLANAAKLHEFYLTGFLHIQKCLLTGKAVRDKLQSKDSSEIIKYLKKNFK